MRKWLIETLVLGLFVGAYMFYGQTIVDSLATQYGMEPSSYLYAAIGFSIIVIASLLGKLLTRGMK